MIIERSTERKKKRKKEIKKERKREEKIERNKERQKENRRKAVWDRIENIGSFAFPMMKQLLYHCVLLTVNLPHCTLADARKTLSLFSILAFL